MGKGIKAKSYVLFREYNIEALEEIIDEMLNDGWELYGPTIINGAPGKEWYYQAMILNK